MHANLRGPSERSYSGQCTIGAFGVTTEQAKMRGQGPRGTRAGPFDGWKRGACMETREMCWIVHSTPKLMARTRVGGCFAPSFRPTDALSTTHFVRPPRTTEDHRAHMGSTASSTALSSLSSAEPRHHPCFTAACANTKGSAVSKPGGTHVES